MPTVAGGCDAAAELARARTSAVITYNDYLALGVMHRLTRKGIRVPDEVSIVGYGDIPAARLVTPSLTTITAPTRAQGIVAVHHLLSIIKGARPHSDEPTVLPVQLNTRDSSAAWICNHRRATSQQLAV
jgi:DNA-binding LacI/PurR family transcriptional regulator